MKLLFYVALISSMHCADIAARATVSYGISGGRLGDNLVAYANALWIAYKREIPLAYLDFKDCEKLALSKIHESYWVARERYTRVIQPQNGEVWNIYDLNIDEDIFYAIPYFPAAKRELLDYSFWCKFDIDWCDEGFVRELQKGIALVNRKPSLISFPANRIPVAVHIRTGEGVEPTHQFSSPKDLEKVNTTWDQIVPRKFPPTSFFIEQLKRMSELLEDKPLYVHIFTDSSCPESFAKLFEQKVNKPNIMYGYRNKPDFLDDFFAMTKFKYLIRGESNFAFMAGVLARCKITIVPANYVWKGTELIITESEVIIR